MKFLKFNAKHLKIITKLIIPLYNYEYHEIQRIPYHNYIKKTKKKHIPCQNNENYENLIIPRQNHENQEIHRISYQNHENHEILIIPQ